MFVSQTIQVTSQSTAVELTANIDTDDRYVVTFRIPDGYSGTVRIGTSAVSSASGFTLAAGEPLTVTLEDARVYAVTVSSSSTVLVDVVAYSA